MDLEHGNGSRKNLKHVEVANNGDDPSHRRIFPSNYSIENSQELFFIDTDVITQIRKAKQDVPELQGSTISSSEVAGQSPPESSHGGSSSVALSSETLMVAQPRGYEPSRIPASVFASKPANATEWSVTSNESLFSLHIGNGSLSREHFLTLYKSGELGKLEDPTKPVKPDESITIGKHADEQIHFQPSLPPVTEGENLDKTSEQDIEKGSNLADTPKATAENHRQGKSPPPPAKNAHVPRQSQGSVNSSNSFAFQVLEDGEEYSAKSINISVAKTDSEKKSSRNELKGQPREESVGEMQQQPPQPTKAEGSSWFSCFPFFSMCQSGRN